MRSTLIFTTEQCRVQIENLEIAQAAQRLAESKLKAKSSSFDASRRERTAQMAELVALASEFSVHIALGNMCAPGVEGNDKQGEMSGRVMSNSEEIIIFIQL